MKKRVGWFLGVLLALNLVSASGDFMEGFISGASFLFGGSNDAITIVKIVLWAILFLILSEVLGRIFHENRASGIIVALLIAWASIRFLPDDFLEEYGATYLGVWLVLLGIALIVWLIRRLWRWLKPKDEQNRWRKGILFVYALIFFILAFLIYKLKDLDLYIPEYSFDIPFSIPFVGAINTLSDLFTTLVHYGIWIFGIAGLIFLIMVIFIFIFDKPATRTEPNLFIDELAKERAKSLSAKNEVNQQQIEQQKKQILQKQRNWTIDLQQRYDSLAAENNRLSAAAGNHTPDKAKQQNLYKQWASRYKAMKNIENIAKSKGVHLKNYKGQRAN